MSPGSTRWRPRRAGLINLYEYANQVFDFAGGRLLLRGHNTSGKTKALELLLPFCLDGDISPKKLDPFGAGYKDMKWNLTGCTGDVKRARATPGSSSSASASSAPRSGSRPVSACATTRTFRTSCAGTSSLATARSAPICRCCEAAIRSARLSSPPRSGDDGEVLETQRDYRNRLNDLLFGFGGRGAVPDDAAADARPPPAPPVEDARPRASRRTAQRRACRRSTRR